MGDFSTEQVTGQHGIKPDRVQFVILVKDLSTQRGPARIATWLYEETPESREARDHLTEMHRLSALANPRADKRPNKKQRRQIIRFTGKGGQTE